VFNQQEPFISLFFPILITFVVWIVADCFFPIEETFPHSCKLPRYDDGTFSFNT